MNLTASAPTVNALQPGIAYGPGPKAHTVPNRDLRNVRCPDCSRETLPRHVNVHHEVSKTPYRKCEFSECGAIVTTDGKRIVIFGLMRTGRRLRISPRR